MISNDYRAGRSGRNAKTPTRRRGVLELGLEQEYKQHQQSNEGNHTPHQPQTPHTDAAIKLEGSIVEHEGGIPISINVRRTSRKKETLYKEKSKNSINSDESDEEDDEAHVELTSQHSRGTHTSTQSIIFQLQGTLGKAKREVTKLRLKLRNKTKERDEFKMQAKQTAEMLTVMREQNVKLLKEREELLETITTLNLERDKYRGLAHERSEKIRELKREMSSKKESKKGTEDNQRVGGAKFGQAKESNFLDDGDAHSMSSDGEPYDSAYKTTTRKIDEHYLSKSEKDRKIKHLTQEKIGMEKMSRSDVIQIFGPRTGKTRRKSSDKDNAEEKPPMAMAA